jgi:hypothetical protein
MKTWLSGDVSKRLALGGDAETAHELELEIEQVRARLAANEAERKELEAALKDLVSRCSAAAADYSSPTIADAPRVMAASSAAEKIALFRRLFAGRADVFPVRWESRKTAKSARAVAEADRGPVLIRQAVRPLHPAHFGQPTLRWKMTARAGLVGVAAPF